MHIIAGDVHTRDGQRQRWLTFQAQIKSNISKPPAERLLFLWLPESLLSALKHYRMPGFWELLTSDLSLSNWCLLKKTCFPWSTWTHTLPYSRCENLILKKAKQFISLDDDTPQDGDLNPVFDMAKAIMTLQHAYGVVPRLVGKGDQSEVGSNPVSSVRWIC